jgi:hypothetical protein
MTTRQQETLGIEPDVEIDLQSKPTFRRFAIENLSQTEWQVEHERARAELGDEAYVALRQSEIDRRSEDFIKMAVINRCKFGPIKNGWQPDRIGLAGGRQFRVGAAQGVPEEITKAMYATFANGHLVKVPKEWLEFEMSTEELWQEERQASQDERRAKQERSQEAKNQRLEILEGRLSVRDCGIGA